MRPLPTTSQANPLATKPVVAAGVAHSLELGPFSHTATPATNRRTNAACPVQRAYPWLLVASTALAAVFCGLYLTKPVIVAGDGPGPAITATAPAPPAPAAIAMAPPKASSSLLPRGDDLPGDTGKPQAADPRRLDSADSGPETVFEETNLRIQHVLKAQGPAGEDLGKIMLEVPVLYRSRALRWTPAEVARARDLMARIGNYQEATRLIRAEGQKLLGEWNALVSESIPTPVLRADSPTLSNATGSAGREELDSTQAIEIQKR